MPEWIWIVSVLGGLYLLLCFAVWLIQEIFMFHPEKLPQDFTFRYKSGYPFEEVFIDRPDGGKINGILFSITGSEGVVFYFKGNTRSIKGWGKFSEDFVPKGYDFFMIDYPGFGKSTGKRTEKSIYSCGQIAYEWLKTRYSEDKIVIYGRSMGSGFAAKVAAENTPKMLILDSAYYSFDHLAQYYAFFLPAKWIVKYHMPIFKYLKKIACPIYLIHGNKDWMIPYVFSVMLRKVTPDHAWLFSIPGGRHNNLPSIPQYHEALEIILNKAPAQSFSFNPQKGEYYLTK